MISRICLALILGSLLFNSGAIADSGGPDAYGYRWVDSDGGGGPAFNWIDITGVGTLVMGLGDDNNVGPIPMGYEFPYYWYTVNHMWIGTNGYISFSFSNNYAHPFTSIPCADTMPNDLLCPLAGDLDFTRGGQCWYWSNNVDSFIVSWIDVPQFSADGSLNDSTHTFQLVLSSRDSSVTFQYGQNHGNFAEGGNLQDVIGIENVNGLVGLEYMEDNFPPWRLWHNGLVIKFHPIPDPNFQIFDAKISEAMNSSSQALFLPVNSIVTLRVLVSNFGTEPISDIPIRCQIRRGLTYVYTEFDTIPSLDPEQQVWLDFQVPYVPSLSGTHRVIFSSLLVGDQNGTNNTKTMELDIYSLPQALRYCDDIPMYSGRAWSLPSSGFASEFEVPDSIYVTSARFYVQELHAAGPASIMFLPANENGTPDEGHVLLAETLMVNQTGWQSVTIPSSPLLFRPEEKLFMTVLIENPGTFEFGADDSQPIARRSWKYIGGYAIDDFREFSDIMFEIYAERWPGGACPYMPGDVNMSDSFNALDVTYAIAYFHGEPLAMESCQCGQNGMLRVAGDVNGSCAFNGVDVTYMVWHLKGGGTLLSCGDCPPFP